MPDTVASWAANISSGALHGLGNVGTLSSMGFAITHPSDAEHSTLKVGENRSLKMGDGSEVHLGFQLQGEPTPTDLIVKAEPNQEPEEGEIDGHKKLISSVQLRRKNALVPVSTPDDYLIRAADENVFMSVMIDSILVMEKIDAKQQATSTFQVQKFLDKESSQFVCCLFHKPSRTYVNVSDRRSISLKEIGETSELTSPSSRLQPGGNNATISSIGDLLDGRNSEAEGKPLTADLSESFSSSIRLSSPESCPAEHGKKLAATIPETCLFMDFDPEMDHVCLAPKKFPEESLSYDENLFVVLVNKSGWKAFSCESVSQNMWKLLRTSLPVILRNKQI